MIVFRTPVNALYLLYFLIYSFPPVSVIIQLFHIIRISFTPACQYALGNVSTFENSKKIITFWSPIRSLHPFNFFIWNISSLQPIIPRFFTFSIFHPPELVNTHLVVCLLYKIYCTLAILLFGAFPLCPIFRFFTLSVFNIVKLVNIHLVIY